MSEDITIVKESDLHKKGIFANRDFGKGEVVLTWKPKLISENEIGKMSEEEKSYVMPDNGKYYIMQEPERYINHSCDSNTKPANWSDVAIRDIKKGEEVTSDYGNNQSINKFECKCGSNNCRRFV